MNQASHMLGIQSLHYVIKKHFNITQKSVPTTNENKWKNNNIRDQIFLDAITVKSGM